MYSKSKKYSKFALLLALIMLISATLTPLSLHTSAPAQNGDVSTFVGDGFTVTTTVLSSWATGHNTYIQLTNTGSDTWYHWVLSINRNMGLPVPTAWGQSWQNNGLFVYQGNNETTVRNLGHTAPIAPGEYVRMMMYSTTTPLHMPTDFRLRPAELRPVPLPDHTYEVLEHSEWLGQFFNHAIEVVNTSNRIIQNWEVHFDITGGGMYIDCVPNAVVTQTTSGSALLAYVPGDGQVLHPGQVIHLGMIGTFVPGSQIVNVRVYERIGTPYGGFPPFVVDPGDNGNDDSGNDDGGGEPGGGQPGDNRPGDDDNDNDDWELDPNRRVLHGIEFEQQMASDLTGLTPPIINNVNVEVLHFERGIYRIRLHVDDCTLDSRANPFFFWASNEGTFEDIIDYRVPYAEFTFLANPGTAGRDVVLMVGVGDGLGQVDRVLVRLKGNDALYTMAVGFDAVGLQAILFDTEPSRVSPIFEPGIPTNIALVLDTSNQMNYVDPYIELPTLLANLAHQAPLGSYISVVAGGTITPLANAFEAATALERIISYGGYVCQIQQLNIAASTLGVDRQNVIVAAVSTLDYALMTKVHELEYRGFIVYLWEYERLTPAFVSRTPRGFMPLGVPLGQIFSDVPNNYWARPYIHDMHRRGFIEGRGDGIFDPEGEASIMEFLTLALRVAGIQVPPAAGLWFIRYINFATANGLFDAHPDLSNVTGIDLNNMVNDTNICREFAFYLVYRVFSLESQTWNRLRYTTPSRTLQSFEDADDISDQYFEALMELVSRHIVTGRPLEESDDLPRLDPAGDISRAEMTRLLFNMISPHGSMFGEIRELEPLVRRFTRLDPNGDTAAHRVTRWSDGRFSIHGAGQHSFTAPQTGVYIFRTHLEDAETYSPTLFRVIGTGQNMRFERVLPAWGSTNTFLLQAGHTFVVESVGPANIEFMPSVTRRGYYDTTVNHYFDIGYTMLLRDRNLVADDAWFGWFNERTDQIFFELVGLNIDAATAQMFASSMDLCRTSRNNRYGNVGIDNACQHHEHSIHCIRTCSNHTHTAACWYNYVLICGHVQLCYNYSCNDAMVFRRRIMAGEGPGPGELGSTNIVWSGNVTNWGAYQNRSFANARGGTNVFMLNREEDTYRILRTYIHEMAHILGVHDHYCGDHPNGGGCVGGIYCWNPACNPELPGRNPRVQFCIMGVNSRVNMATQSAHEMFCQDCINDVQRHLITHLAIYGRGN